MTKKRESNGSIKGLLAPLLLYGLLALAVCLPGYALAGGAHLASQDVQGLKRLKTPFTFAVIGDTRKGDDIYAGFAKRIAAGKPAFVMNLGDVVKHPGDERQWDKFAGLSKPITMPYFIAAGNHDIAGIESERIYKEFVSQPGNEVYYSFVAGPVLVVVIDTEQPGRCARVDGEQFRWLKRVLAGSKERYKFVFMHRPMYPDKKIGMHYNDCLNRYERERDELHRLFQRFKVDAVFAGHEHLYKRKVIGGVRYIVSGGGGARLYAKRTEGGFHHYMIVSIEDGGAGFKVVDLEGRTRDEFRIAKGIR